MIVALRPFVPSKNFAVS
jgi:hypothetical protein